MTHALSLVTGVLFAVGLYLAGVVAPSVVLGAFRFGPGWDPRLFAMFAGALLVQWATTRYLRGRGETLRGKPLRFVSRPVDRRLVLGSLLFGLAWGLGGICPGPGVTALFAGGAGVLVFMGAFVFALWAYDRVLG